VDLSGIIFVALAVAWAAYLIPKALKHHDEVVRSRSVDRFSHTMRVLARREPMNKRDSRLVVTPSRAASTSIVETKAHSTDPAANPAGDPPVGPASAPPIVRTAANRKATRRRRRVLGLLLLVNAAIMGLAASQVMGWVWEAGPAGLVLAGLVACRLMVKKERAVPVARRTTDPAQTAQTETETDVDVSVDVRVDVDVDVARNEQGFDELDPANQTADVPAVPVGDPELWDPLPMTLPTYVTKPAAARRGVRTIALDDEGVWTSGRTEGDAAIAREAEKADKAARTASKQSNGDQAVSS
jgi:hypothetical protein